jgi:hypothetical protein
MAGRIILLAGAVTLIVLGVTRTDAHRACDDGRRAAFAIGAGRLPTSGAAAVAGRLEAHCRGADALVDGVAALLRAHAVGPAAQLAATAVRRERERRDSWVALSRVRQAQGDDGGAARALRRARTLDPLSFAGR